MLFNMKPAARLAFYKGRMPTHGATLAEAIRNHNNPAYASRELSQGKNGDSPIYYGFPDIRGNRLSISDFHGVAGLRCAGYQNQYFADNSRESFRDSTTGYYCDSFYDRTIEPLCFALPHGRGFLPAYWESDNGSLVLYSEICDSARGAMLRAHDIAQSVAEDEREYDAKFRAEQEIEEKREENSATRKALKALISEVRKACPSAASFPAIHEALINSIRDLRNDLEANRARIAALESDPWRAVTD